MPDDPRNAGGGIFDAGGPHDRGKVAFDMRRAVLVEEIETAVAHPTRYGQPAEDQVALVIKGRINRPPDDQITAERPAEHVEHLHIISWDGVADLIVDLHSLAARDGTDLSPILIEKWEKVVARGLTRRANA